MKLELPKLSATMDEGQIVAWLKKEGDAIREGDVLYSVETDKATLEVESTFDGTLEKILAAEGDLVAVGSEVCVIRTEIEIAAVESKARINESGIEIISEEPVQSIAIKNNDFNDRIKISPAARKRARELQVDVQNVQGTGPRGRITIEDIEHTTQSQSAQKSLSQPTSHSQPVSQSQHNLHSQPQSQSNSTQHHSDEKFLAGPSIRVEADPISQHSTTEQYEDVSKMRMAIAKELLQSVQTIPTFWVEKWVNVEQILQIRELLKKSRDHVFQELTISDFVLQAIGLALVEIPNVNKRWVQTQHEAKIETIQGSHVGLAISIEGGLVAPILENVGSLPLADIANVRSSLVDAVRSNRSFSSGKHAAITLSNLGNTGIDRFRAIIKPEESMILALGRVEEKVVVEDNQMVIRKGFTMTLSADHRLIDGVAAARFLKQIAKIIEEGAWKIL